MSLKKDDYRTDVKMCGSHCTNFGRLLCKFDELHFRYDHQTSRNDEAELPHRFETMREVLTEWDWRRAKMMAVFFVFKVENDGGSVTL